jgi:hypothetical protein
LCLAAVVGRARGVDLSTLLMPADRLTAVKAALPQVADPALASVLASPQTLWYDETVMTPSYQDSVGASSNNHWPDLVAAPEDIIGGLHDRTKHRWQFPFGATAGTDEATNLRVENFASFPQENGQVRTVTITQVYRNDNRPEWTWTYQPGTVFGEVLLERSSSSRTVPRCCRWRSARGYATRRGGP